MAGPFADAAGNASGAVGSLFSGFASQKKADMYRIQAQADLLKGEGDRLEGENYGKARELALLNKNYAAESTAVQQAQADRSIYMSIGASRAAIGASGLAESGSALDVLAASAQQGALQKQVLAKQGLITEAGHEEQAETYGNMVEVANLASQAETLASRGHLLAAESEDEAATGSFITSAIKGVASVASLFGGGVVPAGGI